MSNLIRIERILKMVVEIKTAPYQTVDNILKKFNISKAQFYKDKNMLVNIGFEFEYSRSKKCFIIVKDQCLPIPDLTLSERLAIIMAFRQMSAAGDYILSYEGFNAAKKISLELPSPLRESLFFDIVLKEGFGCDRQIFETVQNAVINKRGVIFEYKSPHEEKNTEEELDPYHLFFKRRALYVEGHSRNHKAIRMYRINRIKKIQYSNYYFSVENKYDFGKRHKNAFSAFPGETTEHVKVWFSKKMKPYIEESLWHHSQITTQQEDGSIIFEVDVAEPREVMWWAFYWGANAKILEPEWLKQEACKEANDIVKLYNKRHPS
ncbi:MAG: WYL domain-containing protein [Desulfobacterales bacterium]|nr:WYL domain-containing protein [Desulfobacterales bacterium]